MTNNILWEMSNEKILRTRLSSGLKVAFLPKKGFFRKAAMLVVPFGSEDEEISSKDEIIRFPSGTAHLLEHMLFESKDGFYTRMFTLAGATANAYTTNNRTAVYFSTIGDLDKPLKLLFDMLGEVDFQKNSVNKEKKIVAEEISLYDDEVEQTLYFDLMRAIYHENPVKNDIAGSKESLKAISENILEKAFTHFYQYENMFLVLAGDIDIKSTLEILEKNTSNCQPKSVAFERVRRIDLPGVQKSFYEEKRDLRNSIVMAGVKLEQNVFRTSMEAAVEEVIGYLFLDNYLGKMSGKELELQKQGLVNDTFDFSLSVTENYGHAILYTETKNPKKTIEAFRQIFIDSGEYVIDQDGLDRQKRKMIGDFVLAFDSVSRACSLASEYFARGVDLFEILEAINKITSEDLKKAGQRMAAMPMAFVHYSVR